MYNMTLHTFSDNSVLKTINVTDLIAIPIWRGNRHLDVHHAINIKKEIGNNIKSLDNTIFRIITYMEDGIEQKYLIDGQHRQWVIRSYFQENMCVPDFTILVIQKHVEGESDAIEYFNALNNVKPQHESDSKLLANKYILALEKCWNNKKCNMIRQEGKTTRRPYLSSNLLRMVIEMYPSLLKQDNEYVKYFVERVIEWNKRRTEYYALLLAYEKVKDASILQQCVDKGFILAYDQKLPWVKECLES